MSGFLCDIRKACLFVDNSANFLTNIRNIALNHACNIILFNADNMAGIAHVESALRHAFRAAEEETCISHSVEMEALLYAAGSRQCASAIRFGIHEGMNRVYLCICPPCASAWEIIRPMVTEMDDDWEGIDSGKVAHLMELFGITRAELRASGPNRLKELVLERVALLEVYR
jgi:KEOPS complex subunit Cgi121